MAIGHHPWKCVFVYELKDGTEEEFVIPSEREEEEERKTAELERRSQGTLVSGYRVEYRPLKKAGE